MDLDALLSGCLSNDNQVRKQAEDAIKKVSQDAQIVPELIKRIQTSPNPEARQLAALLLRKRITRHWQRLSQEIRDLAKTYLLQVIVAETFHPVRRAVADVVGVVAKHTVPAGQWPELLGFLHQCSQSSNAEHREVGLTLFASLSETIGEQLQPHVVPLMQVICSGLSDPSDMVRSAALRACEPLLELVVNDAEVAAFHNLLQPLLKGAQEAAAAFKEDLVVLTCQIFVELIERPSPLLKPALPAVLQMCCQLSCNTELELGTREQAMQVVYWVARYKPKQLTRDKGLLKATLETLCKLLCEPVPEDYDDAQTLPASKMAAQALDLLALNIASQHVFPHVAAFVRATAGSANPAERAAAMTAVAVLSEGCSEALRKQLKQVLPLVLQGLQDQDKGVRSAAAFAIGEFSLYLQPEIVECYEQVLPAVFFVMHDPTPEVAERACTALDAFCEALDGEEISPYLQQLVQKLVQVMQQGTRALQESALSALASTAAAAGKSFIAHAGPVVPLLQHFMQQTSNESLVCRCRATECLGLIIEAIGRDIFAGNSLLQQVMEQGLKGFELGYNELNEYTHGLFGCVAKVLGADFAPFLQHTVPLALSSCNQDDGMFDSDEDDEDERSGSVALGSISDDDSEDGGRQLSVRTGLLDEKCAATQVLGIYCEACGPAFLPHYEDTLETLQHMSNYFHEEVRLQSYEALRRLVAAAQKLFPSDAAGNPSPQMQHILSIVPQTLVAAIDEDVDKGAVAAALMALGMMLQQLGPQPLQQHLETIVKGVTLVLKGEAQCQADEESDDEGGKLDEELEANEDQELFAAACELLPVLAAALGADSYAPVFQEQHLPPLVAKLKGRQPDDIRSTACGCLAEVAEALRNRMAPFVEKLMPLLMRELRADDSTNRQNAAFCCGVLCEVTGAAAAPFYPQLLQSLHPMFGANEADSARDNAAGAVGRLLAAAAEQLPLESILPTFLGALPLKEDMEEAVPVYKALCSIVTGPAAQRVSQFVPQIVQAFGSVLVQPEVGELVKGFVAETVKQLLQQYQQHMEPIVAGLPAEQQQVLQLLMHGS